MKIKELFNLFAVSLLIITGLNAMTTEEKLKNLYVIGIKNNADRAIGLSLVDAVQDDLYNLLKKVSNYESVFILSDPQERDIQFPLQVIIYPSSQKIPKIINIEKFKDRDSDEYSEYFKGQLIIPIGENEHRVIITINKIVVEGDDIDLYIEKESLDPFKEENFKKEEIIRSFDNPEGPRARMYQRMETELSQMLSKI